MNPKFFFDSLIEYNNLNPYSNIKITLNANISYDDYSYKLLVFWVSIIDMLEPETRKYGAIKSKEFRNLLLEILKSKTLFDYFKKYSTISSLYNSWYKPLSGDCRGDYTRVQEKFNEFKYNQLGLRKVDNSIMFNHALTKGGKLDNYDSFTHYPKSEVITRYDTSEKIKEYNSKNMMLFSENYLQNKDSGTTVAQTKILNTYCENNGMEVFIKVMNIANLLKNIASFLSYEDLCNLALTSKIFSGEVWDSILDKIKRTLTIRFYCFPEWDPNIENISHHQKVCKGIEELFGSFHNELFDIINYDSHIKSFFEYIHKNNLYKFILKSLYEDPQNFRHNAVIPIIKEPLYRLFADDLIKIEYKFKASKTELELMKIPHFDWFFYYLEDLEDIEVFTTELETFREMRKKRPEMIFQHKNPINKFNFE